MKKLGEKILKWKSGGKNYDQGLVYVFHFKKILNGEVQSFVNELTRLNIAPESDVYQWDYYFDSLKGCSIFASSLLILFLHFKYC